MAVFLLFYDNILPTRGDN